jgi:hypothetical protein
MWRHHGDQEPRRWFAEQQSHRLPKPEFLSLFYKLPHLVERDDNHFSLGLMVQDVCALRRGPNSEPRHH